MKIGLITAQQLLKECAVFATLKSTDLEKIAGLSMKKEYEAGAVILREGDSAEELILIQEGKVALQIMVPAPSTQTIRGVTMEFLGKNDVLGWSGLLEPFVYTATAVCLQKVNALSVSRTKLTWLLDDNPAIGYEVLKQLVKLVAAKMQDTRYLLASERMLPTNPEPTLYSARRVAPA